LAWPYRYAFQSQNLSAEHSHNLVDVNSDIYPKGGKDRLLQSLAELILTRDIFNAKKKGLEFVGIWVKIFQNITSRLEG